MPPSQHDLPTHKHLFCNLVLKRALEYFQITCTLAPISLTPTSFDTTLTFTALHRELDIIFLLFLEDNELN